MNKYCYKIFLNIIESFKDYHLSKNVYEKGKNIVLTLKKVFFYLFKEI